MVIVSHFHIRKIAEVYGYECAIFCPQIARGHSSTHDQPILVSRGRSLSDAHKGHVRQRRATVGRALPCPVRRPGRAAVQGTNDVRNDQGRTRLAGDPAGRHHPQGLGAASDYQNLRSDGIRAAAQHTLQGAHWSGRALSRSSSSSSTAAVDGWSPASLASLRIMTSSRSSASITSRVRIPLSRCAQGKGSAAPHCRLTGGHPTVVDGPMLVVSADVSDQIAATAGGPQP